MEAGGKHFLYASAVAAKNKYSHTFFHFRLPSNIFPLIYLVKKTSTQSTFVKISKVLHDISASCTLSVYNETLNSKRTPLQY